MSTLILGSVLRVVNVLPQAQCAVQVMYLGWILDFMALSTPCHGRASAQWCVNVSRDQLVIRRFDVKVCAAQLPTRAFGEGGRCYRKAITPSRGRGDS